MTTHAARMNAVAMNPARMTVAPLSAAKAVKKIAAGPVTVKTALSNVKRLEAEAEANARKTKRKAKANAKADQRALSLVFLALKRALALGQTLHQCPVSNFIQAQINTMHL